MKDKMSILQKKIKEKEREIKAAELLLEKLNNEADALYKEFDDLEAMELIRKMDDKGLTIEEAWELIK